MPHFREALVAFLKGASETWSRFTSEFAPGGLIDEATTEEKELAFMPPTNDENEGALGEFRQLMRRQPQLSLVNYNAMAMFFKNNTEAFMAAKFTEKEDFQYIHKLGRESKKQEKLQRKEIIKARDDRQAARIATREKKKQRADETAQRLAETKICFKKEEVIALKGDSLKDMLEIYQQTGAPGLDNIRRSDKVGVIRQALSDAIDQYNSGEWVPYDEDEFSTDEEADEDNDDDSVDTDAELDESD